MTGRGRVAEGPRAGSPALVDGASVALRRALTTLMGAWAESSLSRPLVGPFARRYGVDLSELDRPLAAYPTLAAFFGRALPAGARPIAADPAAIVAPCDGIFAHGGTVADGTLVQAKGIRYRLADLVGDAQTASLFAHASYATIYLRPGDYHRVHAPIAGRVLASVHVGGTLFPVHARAAARIDGLYRRNERVTTLLESAAGPLAVVQVGAFIVGSVRLAYAGAPAPGRRTAGVAVHTLSPPAPLARGDEIGRFALGSTVVVLAQAGVFRASQLPAPGTRLRMGERLADPGGRRR